jgi:hypothetical protein
MQGIDRVKVLFSTWMIASLIMLPWVASAITVKFLIRTEEKAIADQAGDTYGGLYPEFFESAVRDKLKDAFACAEVRTVADLYALIVLEREKALLGVGDDKRVEALGGAFGCDFLISILVTSSKERLIFSAKCMRPDSAMVLARVFMTTTNDDGALDVMKDAAAELVEQLKKFEICPFTGTVKIEVSSKRGTESREEYAVYCNGMDQQYLKVTEISERSSTLLDLQKIKWEYTSGYMKYEDIDSNTIREENGCYKCPSGREGGRISTETVYTRKAVEDFSQMSSIGGAYTDDIRISLVFLDNNTYLIRVRGASEKNGTWTQQYRLKAEGTCDNRNESPPAMVNTGLAIPCNYLFGPYPGRAYSNQLKGSYTTVKNDPVTKEQTVLLIEFDLKKSVGN